MAPSHEAFHWLTVGNRRVRALVDDVSEIGLRGRPLVASRYDLYRCHHPFILVREDVAMIDEFADLLEPRERHVHDDTRTGRQWKIIVQSLEVF